MSMIYSAKSASDGNIKKILSNSPLVWRLIEPEIPEFYLQSIQPKGPAAFFKRLFGKNDDAPVVVPNLEFVPGENDEMDLDKAWQGIHYCIHQTEMDAEPPMDFLTVGGIEIGDMDVGYGPARALWSVDVALIAEKLSNVTVETFKGAYDPEAMENLDIYPQIWMEEGDEAFEYLEENFKTLKKFVAQCAQQKLGMVVYLT